LEFPGKQDMIMESKNPILIRMVCARTNWLNLINEGGKVVSRKSVAWLVCLLLVSSLIWGQDYGKNAAKEDWEEINFEINLSVITDGFPSLLKLAELLQKNPDYRIKVEGHTDSVGSSAYNDKLAKSRAESVKAFLTKYGARPDQVSVSAFGKAKPKVENSTKAGRFVNRRVQLTLTDGQGRIISSGGISDTINAFAKETKDPCCDPILKKLDEILAALKGLQGDHDRLKDEVAALKQAREAAVKEVQPPPPPAAAMKAPEPPPPTPAPPSLKKFSLLGLNAGPDSTGNLAFTGKGRFFAPFSAHQAVQAEAEYMHYHDRQEGQFDLGLVNRVSNLQVGLFGSFRHINFTEFQNGGTLGQAAVTADYLFNRGRIGFFGTKAFLDNAVVNQTPLSLNVMEETLLKAVSQVGGSAQIGLWGDAYVEGHLGALFRPGGEHKPGGGIRLVQPVSPHWALSFEGGLNETMVGNDNNGRFAVGIQLGNWIRPKGLSAMQHPVPVEIPRVRYEVITRQVRTGNSAPVADAGPDQLNMTAGTITLDGSGSYDPEGDPMTYQWVQTGGPTVSLAGANTVKSTFTAAQDTTYTFRLTVKDDKGATSTARVTITTRKPGEVPRIIRLQAVPTNIAPGESSTLTWETEGADEVTMSGIGTVRPNGAATVSPSQTTTYKLTAKNAQGEVNSTVTVQVGAAQLPRVIKFSASPVEILPTEQASLVWQVENATEVSISGIGKVDLVGTSTVSPTANQTYTITAKNATGEVSATAVVGVVRTVKVLDFVANPPSSEKAGSPVTLTWKTTDATEVVITGVGTVPVNGSVTVSPSSTTSYSLVAYGKRSQATAFVVVKVGAVANMNNPPVADAGPNQTTTLASATLDGSKSYDPDGDPITYSWRVTGSNPANITGGNTAHPTVNFLKGYGDYQFELTVTDSKGARGTNTTVVTFIDP
jgi:hypothetical protein